MTAPVRGIVFDKDGTLFDFNKTWAPVTARLIASEAAGDSALAAELARVLGYDQDAGVFLPDSLVIASTAEDVEAAVLPLTRDNDLQALRDRMRAATSDAVQVAAADLQSVLGELIEMGQTLGIATNDAEAPAKAHLGRAGVQKMFAFIAGFDSGFGSKPAPGQLHEFCAATGISPGECLMVGDSLHDIHAGQAAGMRTIGVLTGPARRDELAPHADVVLDSIADMPDWLAQG